MHGCVGRDRNYVCMVDGDSVLAVAQGRAVKSRERGKGVIRLQSRVQKSAQEL